MIDVRARKTKVVTEHSSQEVFGRFVGINIRPHVRSMISPLDCILERSEGFFNAISFQNGKP